jgi:hypothetical protein
MIVTLNDDKDEDPIVVRGEPRSAAMLAENIIRQHRLVDGSVGISGVTDYQIINITQFYLGSVIAEVYDEPAVEASYADLDVYALAKYPRRRKRIHTDG